MGYENWSSSLKKQDWGGWDAYWEWRTPE